MKTIFAMLVCVLLTPLVYGQTTNVPEKKQEKKGVELQITAVSSASYLVSEQGEDGKWHWEPPSERVQFSNDYGM